MTPASERAHHFLSLHRRGEPLLLANAWDAGSARVLTAAGFEALATTSAGHAGSLGRRDGRVSRGEALEHARALALATLLPVSADLEHGFADAPEDVAATIAAAAKTGLAGGSIEDSTGRPEEPIYPADLATARIAAAAEVAGTDFVLTARCENHLHGRDDLDDTIARLRAYARAGAHVVYAPGVTDPAAIRRIVDAVEVPVNVLCLPAGPGVPELAALGVARISVGSAFFLVAIGALAEAAREWREQGTHGFWRLAGVGRQATAKAFPAD